MDKNFYCVIMAGGVGSRFWPISRNALPKQFLDILGIGKSFLQLTYDRFTKIVPKENIIVVTSAAYADPTWYSSICPTFRPRTSWRSPTGATLPRA